MRNERQLDDQACLVRLRLAEYLRNEAADHARGGGTECRWEAAGLTRLAEYVQAIATTDERIVVLADLHPEHDVFTPLTPSASAEVNSYARTWPACERVDSACALVVGLGLELSADAWLTRFVLAEAEADIPQRAFSA